MGASEAHAMSTSASIETVSFYCHTCSGIFSLPAPSSLFHFTLCPCCREDYLDDFPTPPQPVLPPPPPPCAVSWPSRSITSSTPLPSPPIPSSSSSPSSTTFIPRPSTTVETMSTSHDLLPPPLPPWLLQAPASHDCFSPSDCPPRPPPPVAPLSFSPSSSSTSTLPRTLASPCVRPSSSSTRPPPPPSSHDAWEYFFGPSDPVVATGKEGPPLNMSVRQLCHEFRVLCSQEEQRRRSSPAVSPLSSAYSSSCSSPLLASPPLHRQHQDELQLELFPLSLSPSTTSPPPPPPPPPPPALSPSARLPWATIMPTPLWDSPFHGRWDTFDEYGFSSLGSDYESPLRPPPPLPPVPPISAYEATFESSLQRRGFSPPVSVYDATFDTPLPPVSAYEATFESSLQRRGLLAAPTPVSAHDATFDTPLQRGGSQPAPAESIAALPTVCVTDTELVCPICTDPLLVSAPARRLPCGHLYHSDCIVTWLSLRNSCPVCRGSIPMYHSTAGDIVSSPSPSLHPTPSGRRRSLQGMSRIRRICSRLLRRMEISRDRQDR